MIKNKVFKDFEVRFSVAASIYSAHGSTVVTLEVNREFLLLVNLLMSEAQHVPVLSAVSSKAVAAVHTDVLKIADNDCILKLVGYQPVASVVRRFH